MRQQFSALLVAAPRSGEGKTSVAGALAKGFSALSLKVACFKCGPDFIDPKFLEAASGSPCFNLDTWIMGADGARATFARESSDADIAIVEGVMGLCDGKGGEDGEGSSLDCARALGIPVLLAINAKGMAASIVAVVEGCTLAARRKGVEVIGVVATKTGSIRHQQMLATALEKAKLPPLLGALQATASLDVPSRKLGLVALAELGDTAEKAYLQALEAAALEGIDLEAIREQTLRQRPWLAEARPAAGAFPKKRLALASDEAFCFLYPENLAWIEAQGWEPVRFSPLRDASVPEADAIFLSGGYPEAFAKELSQNLSMRKDLAAKANAGLPVYAEGGGFVYLTGGIEKDGETFPMCGVIEAKAFSEKKRVMGYREASLLQAPPFGTPAQTLRGHEFHWSSIKLQKRYPPLALVQKRDGRSEEEGVVAGPAGNVLATSLHLFWRSGARTQSKSATLRMPSNSKLCLERGATGQNQKGGEKGKGLVVLISGPSSSGKSTLARETERMLKKSLPSVVRLSLDGLLQSASVAGESVSTLEDAEALGLNVAATYHAQIAAIAESGRVVVCDHVLQDDPSWQADLQGRLSKAELFPVFLSCDRKTLAERETQRSDRQGDPLHALSQAWREKQAPSEGLRLDSSASSPQELALQIVSTIKMKFL